MLWYILTGLKKYEYIYGLNNIILIIHFKHHGILGLRFVVAPLGTCCSSEIQSAVVKQGLSLGPVGIS